MAVLLFIGIIIIGGVFLNAAVKKPKFVEARFGSYDDFAKCLTEKGVKVYTAYWNGFSENQRKIFGASFGFLNSKECAIPGRLAYLDPECEKNNVRNYPTWEFPGGLRKTGEVIGMSELSGLSGCPLSESLQEVK